LQQGWTLICGTRALICPSGNVRAKPPIPGRASLVYGSAGSDTFDQRFASTHRNRKPAMLFFSAARKAAIASLILAAFMTASSPGVAADGKTPKEMVTTFYRMVFEAHRVKEAFDLYVGPTYKQHNPRVPDGAAASIKFLADRFETNPQATNKIIRTIADGDLVAVHVHSTLNPDDRGRAIVDIFRVQDGKIVEHWDVIQPVPEETANSNGMF
jgi:predicted SnoaL-like aldol condensation-catalyzing enzyme